jgi:hypothetical protein
VAGLALALVQLAAPAAAPAVAVDGLYQGVVAGDGSDAGRGPAAVEALKQVVVRVTGQRAAAADPALAGLIADARRFAQTFKPAPGGQVAVDFDAAALNDALLAAGQRLWSRERPATLIVLVSEVPGKEHNLGAAGNPEVRREIERNAQLRGLPLAWPTGLDPSAEQAAVGDALAGRLEPLQELAQRFDAAGVLIGHLTTSGATWTWLGPAGGGAAAGPAADAVQLLADGYGAHYALAGAGGGRLVIAVHGVLDLAGYAAATAALTALSNVRGVELEEAAGETLRFRVAFSGEPEALRQAAASGGRLAEDDSAATDGALHFLLRP